MTIKINADTTDGLKFVSDTSGVVEIQNNGTTVITSSQPTFSGRISSTQSVSPSTFTKMAVATEDWDTDSKFDSSTNYRFTPTVAGYYMFRIGMRSNSTTTNGIALYKNGSIYKRKFVESTKYVAFSIMVYSDTDDYFEAYGYTTGTEFDGNADDNYFQGNYIRS